MRSLRIAMAQINCTVGDLPGNSAKIADYIGRARDSQADIVTFPELALTGYPPEDLLLKPRFIADNRTYLDNVVAETGGLAAVIGFVDRDENGAIYNAAAVASEGRLCGVYRKMLLPNYGVFDEKRYFVPGSGCLVFVIRGVIVGVNVCEDIWEPWGPTSMQVGRGRAEVIININASPYHVGKWRYREEMLSRRASENAVFVTYNNLVGGQDELVFDGHGLVLDPRGLVLARGRPFREDLIIADLDLDEVVGVREAGAPQNVSRGLEERGIRCEVECIEVSPGPLPGARSPLAVRDVAPPERLEGVYEALVLGVRDYVRKNGFEVVVIGISGGIDSALVAAIAVDALGAENVKGAVMPSPYTTDQSLADATEVIARLGISSMTIDISSTYQAYLSMLEDVFAGKESDVTEENIQARIRGNVLMGLSNKFGWLVLTTGNKSEMAVGYATLYGDMAGGFAVIKDVPKTMVYELARYRNERSARGPVIPENILLKEPSAELRHGQIDQDALPPYRVLDPILKAYVEEDRSVGEIVDLGYEEALVRCVIAMVDRAEYKRRQAPPGVKITPRAFGKDRRLPITNWYGRAGR
jgi:NAD+ synthase (glutamine-hydrolysing)